ncbi:MAG TPA: aspartyl/asparaginyl beta-hydroxylase domain-containing protein [Solirubrobacteraceae bacterium]|nr:aspartyl/asparaginyl beta-hydroxylase domain-containing protein [Solirubrobacteraceae bacterium]
MVSRLRIRLPVDVDALAADVEGLSAKEWVPHFNTGYYEGDWSGVALRSSAGAPLALYPDPTAEPGDWAATEALGRCPALATLLDEFDCELQSVRLLALGPGARIREHRDYRLGYDDGELRIHIPVTTSPDVEFIHDGERVAMAAGEVWYLDFNLPHSVANPGDARRVHLVIDCVLNPWLDGLLKDAAPEAG